MNSLGFNELFPLKDAIFYALRVGQNVFRRLLPQIQHSITLAGYVILQIRTRQKESTFILLGSGWEITHGWAETHPNLIIAPWISRDDNLNLGGGQKQ
jgi:hypothetical protein